MGGWDCLYGVFFYSYRQLACYVLIVCIMGMKFGIALGIMKSSTVI